MGVDDEGLKLSSTINGSRIVDLSVRDVQDRNRGSSLISRQVLHDVEDVEKFERGKA